MMRLCVYPDAHVDGSAACWLDRQYYPTEVKWQHVMARHRSASGVCWHCVVSQSTDEVKVGYVEEINGMASYPITLRAAN